MVLEMENSRSSFDRSRDQGLMKRLRLSEESVRPPNSNARTLAAHRPIGSVAAAAAAAASASRYQGSVGESDGSADPSREAYQPRPINLQQELVAQYKLALSELTINSKLIITNLTIIAGENLQAAKAISATICNNILEVPSERKLPSLYLLDSIAKNIGNDYVKYFAARLPEVFIKAYRQVDPPKRSDMRHLFGTWKGVFHPQTLQMIDQEAGFASTNDTSSSTVATFRTDPQPQLPPHSIHVNPKYLERQRLQQPASAKGMIDELPGLIASSAGNGDRLERSIGISAKASWIDPSVKNIQRSQRGTLIEPLHEKDTGATPGEYEYGSDPSQNPRLGIKRTGERAVKEGCEKPWYGARNSVPEMISGQRDGLNVNKRISNHSTARLANAEFGGVGRGSIGMSNSWKNSDEEEFMWDMHSRLPENDLANISRNSKNDLWTPCESEKLDSVNNLLGPPRNQPQVASSHVGTSVSGILPNSASGSARQSPLSHSTLLQNSAKQDFKRTSSLPHRDPRASQFSGKPLSISNNIVSPSTSGNASGLSNLVTSEVSAQTSMSSLLAAVMKTGILSNNLIRKGTKDESFEDEGKQLSEFRVQHSPTSSGPRVLPTSLPSSASHDNTSVHAKVEQSFLPSGLPPSLSVTTSTQDSNGKNKATDPSNPLNSLVSKGLISYLKIESPSFLQPQMPSTVLDQSPANPPNSSAPISAALSEVRHAPSADQASATASKAQGAGAQSESAKLEVENLIGLQFRPDIIREFHPSVISSLFDDLLHQCSSCGIHLELKEQLARHLELHGKKNLESNNACRQSSVWFPKADDWLFRRPGQLESEPAILFGESEMAMEDGPMVPADESQYACILCGGLFEDYFSQESDRWMFKEAVYMTIPSANPDAKGPVVHASCISESWVHDLGFTTEIKQWEMDI